MTSIWRTRVGLLLAVLSLSTPAVAADPPAPVKGTAALPNAREAAPTPGANFAFVALEKRPDRPKNLPRSQTQTPDQAQRLPPVKHAPPEQ